MKSKLFITLLCLVNLNSQAQNKLIKLETENNPDGSVTVYASSYASGIYTLKVEFNITGFNASINNPFTTLLQPGRSQICKFLPDRNSGNRYLSFNYGYFAGKSYRKSPENYLHYALPIMPGKTSIITPVTHIKTLLEQKIDQYDAQGFTYALGDTICAARAGVVFNVNDQLKQGEGKTITYADNRNKIHIQHKDGTVAHYTILAPMQSLVENGDFVIPGQPIAIFNKPADKFQVLFSVLYLDDIQLRAENPIDVYHTLPVHYYLNQNALSTTLTIGQRYQSAPSLEIISKELSKKELKRFGLSD
ncbi:MAG: hypothetical protein KA534_00615 [Sediminibacterium sp.]|nr:hypothetical protein [Sediminibacterium sp.]MBP6145551.1 hypothetical protein [Sediminibacterium sp.]